MKHVRAATAIATLFARALVPCACSGYDKASVDVTPTSSSVNRARKPRMAKVAEQKPIAGAHAFTEYYYNMVELGLEGTDSHIERTEYVGKRWSRTRRSSPTTMAGR